jgi:hypothetical protein
MITYGQSAVPERNGKFERAKSKVFSSGPYVCHNLENFRATLRLDSYKLKVRFDLNTYEEPTGLHVSTFHLGGKIKTSLDEKVVARFRD